MKNAITLRMDVNGTAYLLETYSSEAIQISKRVRTVEEVESAQGSITKLPFRIPLIGDAVKLFGSLKNLSSSSVVDIRKLIPGSILINNFPRFVGSFSVMGLYEDIDSGITEVELIFKGEEITLKQELSNMSLSELLEGEQVTYNILEINDFLVDPAGYYQEHGLAWPLIDYGAHYTYGGGGLDLSTEPLTQAHFKPAVGITKILDLLFKKRQLDIQFSFDDPSDKTELLNHVIPLHNSEDQLPTTTTSEKEGAGVMRVVGANSQTVTLQKNVKQNIPIPYDNVIVYTTNHFDIPNKTYTAPVTGTYTISPYFWVTLNNIAANSNIHGSLVVKLNGVRLESRPIGLFLQIRNTAGMGYSWQQEMNAGDILTLEYELELSGASSPASDTVDVIVQTAKFDVSKAPAIALESKVILSENTPDLSVWDVIKTLITMVNGVVISNNGYTIRPWAEWIEEGVNYELDSRIVSGQTIKFTPASAKAPKRILFTYEDDDDIGNATFKRITGQTYGSLMIADTGTDLSNDTKEIKLPFAATPPLNIEGTDIYIPKFVNENWETVNTKPRLLKLTNEFFGTTFSVKDVVSTIHGDNQIIPQVLHWESVEGGFNTNDWNWGTTPNFFASQGYPYNTLYKRWWEKYILETYGRTGKTCEMQVHMSHADFDNMKMNERIIWRGSEFRFNAIENFNISKVVATSIEIALRPRTYNIDIAPYYPYDTINGVVQWKDSLTNAVVGSPDPAALQASAQAYGFYYDADNYKAIQQAKLIQI